MTSLRRRLLVGAGVGTVAILVLADTALYAMMRASLLREFDRALLEKAATLSALIEQSDDEIILEFTDAEMGESQRTQRPEYFQVWREDGTVVGKSPFPNFENLPRKQSESQQPVVEALELPGYVPGRMVTLNFTPKLDDERPPPTRRARLTFALARDIVDVSSSLNELRALLIVVGAGATLASLGVLTMLVRIGLKPVERLANTISQIDEGRLAARIDPTESPRELTSIVNRLNELLERLDAAFSREKTLTANIAHELRTPLAGIRSTLEVALSRDRDSATSRQVMSDCLQICTQTQRLVENLLAMARMEAGNGSQQSMLTDVAALLRNSWKPYANLARDRGVTMQWDVDAELEFETDPEKLQVVLTNVLENAAMYVDAGGVITMQAGLTNGRLQIRLSNTGSTIAKDDVARVFDSFWRGDASRAATGTHHGLGLPLCKAVLERLAGEIRADSTVGGTFVVSITI